MFTNLWIDCREQAKALIQRKRPVLLSITHILCSEEEAEVDIGEAGETSPDDRVAWRWVA